MDSVCSVDYLFSTEDTEGHGGGLTKTKTKTITKTFNGGCVASASGRFGGTRITVNARELT